MKTRFMSFLVAGGLLGLAVWLVHFNNSPAPFAQGREPKPGQREEIPEMYRKTVDKGLEYLVKNQSKDGHWEGDGGKHPVAMTGLVGLALLMDGVSRDGRVTDEGRELEKKYKSNIRNAADWLMDKSQARRDGLIFSDHPSETARYMKGHGFATLFLAGACKYEQDIVRRKKFTDVLIRAVKYIAKAQSSQGGWYDTSKVEGHDFDSISATVIQIQALQAAENAGIPVPIEVVRDAQEYLKNAMAKYDEKTKPVQDRGRQADVAAALVGSPNPGAGALDHWRMKKFKTCQTEIPVGRDVKFGRDELTHYYYAQAVFDLRGDSWGPYRTAMFDHLQSTQNKDGSWPAGDGMSVGPVCATAMWCTILQLDNDCHPSVLREYKVK